jgi:hypothetical protein
MIKGCDLLVLLMGNKKNQQRDGQGTKKALETQVTRRLATRDRQCKSRATKR